MTSSRRLVSSQTYLLLAALATTLIHCGPGDDAPITSMDMNPPVEDASADLFVRDMPAVEDEDMSSPDEEMGEDMSDPADTGGVEDMMDMPDMASEDMRDIPSCEDVTCEAGAVCQDATGTCTLPQSCADQRSLINTANPIDQFHTLYAEGDEQKPWQVWCAGMATATPREYLPLAMTHGDHNVFERFGEPVQPGAVGMSGPAPQAPFARRLTRTRYEKVRIDPYSFTIDPFDDTFATTTVFQDEEEEIDRFNRPVPFGQVEGCALQLEESQRETASGRVDLRHTPFALDQTWTAMGVCPQEADTSLSSLDQVASLSITGGSPTARGCGVVAPTDNTDYFPSGCDTTGGAVEQMIAPLPEGALDVKLTYVGGESATALRPKTCFEALFTGACTNDGACSLYVGRQFDRQWTARCEDMTTPLPKTYIEIHRGEGPIEQDNHLMEKLDANGSRTHATFYSRVRIDGHAMLVDVTDRTYGSKQDGFQGITFGDFAISESCWTRKAPADKQGKFTRNRLTIEEADNNLRFSSPLLPYGECVTLRDKLPDGSRTTKRATTLFDPVSIEELIYAGVVTNADGSTRDGCGGYVPEPLAMKLGYLDCREDLTGEDYRPPRYSTEDSFLFEFAHVDGNP